MHIDTNKGYEFYGKSALHLAYDANGDGSDFYLCGVLEDAQITDWPRLIRAEIDNAVRRKEYSTAAHLVPIYVQSLADAAWLPLLTPIVTGARPGTFQIPSSEDRYKRECGDGPCEHRRSHVAVPRHLMDLYSILPVGDHPYNPGKATHSELKKAIIAELLVYWGDEFPLLVSESVISFFLRTNDNPLFSRAEFNLWDSSFRQVKNKCRSDLLLHSAEQVLANRESLSNYFHRVELARTFLVRWVINARRSGLLLVVGLLKGVDSTVGERKG